MSAASFKAEIKRRIEKGGSGILAEWDRLAEKHNVPSRVGNVPDDIPTWVGLPDEEQPTS